MIHQKSLLSVLKRQPPARIPIWFMRQAGRYLPEYRELRRHFPDFIEMCLDRDASVAAALQPLERFDLDAAIVFSDIMIPLHALGMKVRFVEGKGPVLERLGLEYAAADFLQYSFRDEVLFKVSQAIRALKKVLAAVYPQHTLIGFAGAPWTLFCYMVAGGGSRDFAEARQFVYENYELSLKIIDRLSDLVVEYLGHQIEAGVEAVQLFDSWAGVVPVRLGRDLLFNPVRKIVTRLKELHPEVPVIVFPKGVGNEGRRYAMLNGVDALGVDGSFDVESVSSTWLEQCALQGNIDNVLLTAKLQRDTMVKVIAHTYHLLRHVRNDRLIVNTAHGLLPGTKIENVHLLISTVRAHGAAPTA